ncbi:pentatricopeptide repeat-containing protein At2g36240-like [Ananas comosus]|uniref:Pentatricopeptide repeat-containing protein n=1 Tax=Ananas comosus TaxID=4615 RepID=A0A199UEG7_ANACO|nr:pentatricopeptide repeat-containing protein At2g36240-like [Ananas comosus]OAY63262.1 Pentatricopeptide repeat-containing protein [Ananas comosus]
MLSSPALRDNGAPETLHLLPHGATKGWGKGKGKGRMVITMRDRSKNRKPTQRGRYLSIEAINAVQSLKRARIRGADALDRALDSKLRRLIMADMVAVFKELLAQGEALLALQVFEEIRKEYWYKPQLSLYTDMTNVLASSGLNEKVELMCSYLKAESLEADTEGFNSLLKVLLEFGFTHLAVDCFRLMKLWESDPDETTYRVLINGLESKGEMDLYSSLRLEAENYFGGPLEFLGEKEEIVESGGAVP